MAEIFSFLKWVESIQGEYWIDEHGDVMYADGDIGDYNHEAHVINQLQRQIVDAWTDAPKDYDKFEYVDWDQFCKDIIAAYQEQHPDEDDDRVLMQMAMNDLGVDEYTYNTANGLGDAREYGMKVWGWKRVQGTNVETWNFTPQDMKVIAHGLNDILGQESYDDDDQKDQTEFDIYVYSNKKNFSMTLDQLENGGAKPADANTTSMHHHGDAAMNYLNQQKPSNPYYKNFGDWVVHRGRVI